jgi:hypothetical protein
MKRFLVLAFLTLAMCVVEPPGTYAEPPGIQPAAPERVVLVITCSGNYLVAIDIAVDISPASPEVVLCRPGAPCCKPGYFWNFTPAIAPAPKLQRRARDSTRQCEISDVKLFAYATVNTSPCRRARDGLRS